MEYLHSDLTKQVIGIAIMVHRKLGPGFKEVIYGDALALELHRHSIAFEREKAFNVFYDEVCLQRRFKADFVLLGKVIVEIKASPIIFSQHFKQILNYLKVSGLQVGLILNFGAKTLQIKRVVNTRFSA